MLWFSAAAEGDDELPTGGYLEVWYALQTEHTPPAVLIARAVTIGMLPGSYDRPCVFYLRIEPIREFQGDLQPFLSDALNRPNAVEQLVPHERRAPQTVDLRLHTFAGESAQHGESGDNCR